MKAGQQTVTEVKQTFDFDYQMQHRPWLMVGGSVLVGYTLARLVTGPRTTTSSSLGLDSPPRERSESRTATQDSVASIKGEVLDVVTGTLWAMAAQGLFSPDTQPHRAADAIQPEPPVNPQVTHELGRSTL